MHKLVSLSLFFTFGILLLARSDAQSFDADQIMRRYCGDGIEEANVKAGFNNENSPVCACVAAGTDLTRFPGIAERMDNTLRGQFSMTPEDDRMLRILKHKCKSSPEVKDSIAQQRLATAKERAKEFCERANSIENAQIDCGCFMTITEPRLSDDEIANFFVNRTNPSRPSLTRLFKDTYRECGP